MVTRVFLVLSALVWLPYGIYCFLEPGSLAAGAGIAAATPTGTVELRAMYGGLQIAIGALAALGAGRPALARPACITLACLCSGLGVSRLLASLAAGPPSSYTALALVFEWTSAAVALALLARDRVPAA
jgi:hypothetical protein